MHSLKMDLLDLKDQFWSRINIVGTKVIKKTFNFKIIQHFLVS